MIPTPALILDIATAEENMRAMKEYLDAKHIAIRPHTKSHKTPMLAHLQMKYGAVGICCASIGEAETMAACGLNDILITSEIVTEDKIRRLVSLCRYTKVTAVVDTLENLAQIAEAANKIDVTVGILIELDAKMGRCGVQDAESAIELARYAHNAPGIQFRGLMGYEGHVQFIGDRAERTRLGNEANNYLVGIARAIEAAGIPVEIVSAAGTGSFDIAAECTGITEVEAGSYLLMDLTYSKLDSPFKQSLTVLATVISRPTADRVILDVGAKEISIERQNPVVQEDTRLEVSLNEEHGIISFKDIASKLKIGQKVHLIPSHCCNTVNLHDYMYVVRNGILEAIWPILGRGAF